MTNMNSTLQHSNTPLLHHSFPIVWTIAGTDPGGGAGIQGDLKTMHALGVHGCSVITAVIAQNTRGVSCIEYPSIEIVEEQLRSLREDLPPAAVKIGVVGRRDVVRAVIRTINDMAAPVVCDPVLSSSGGASFLEPDALNAIRDELLPRMDLLTPNIPEAEILLGHPIHNFSDTEQAAGELLRMGARSVLIKGGHRDGSHSQDFWTDGRQRVWLTSEMMAHTGTHGTGCALSSAVASALALGWPMLDALVIAKAYVYQGIRTAPAIGHGRGPLAHGPWPLHPGDMPWITHTAEEGPPPSSFPSLENEAIGLYPIVDNAKQVDQLAVAGVRMIQIRIKQELNAGVERELRKAITCASERGVRLFVNDHWKIAIEKGAYGVHLGQDDLAPDALKEIREAGLRLGISTHSYSEIARAWAYRPSYIAIGTVYRTPSKVMDYEPLGLDRFRKLCSISPVPVVAIGGLKVENAADVLAAGASGVAVISDLAEAKDLEKRVAEWRKVITDVERVQRPC